MKRIISLALVLTLVLTGCATTTEKIDNHEVKKSMAGEFVIKEDGINNKGVVISYSEDDEISKYITDTLLLDIRDTGYALYPNKDYFRPEYIPVDGKLNVVYLQSEMPKLFAPINNTKKDDTIKVDNTKVPVVVNISGCDGDNESVNCQVAKAIGSGIQWRETKAPEIGFNYDVLVSINGQVTTIWLKQRPEVDNFVVSMSDDSGLNVMGIGAGDSKHSSGLSFGGLFNKNNTNNEPVVIVNKEENILNSSGHKEVVESGFTDVKTNPLSTFAADVDTASYTNFRSVMKEIMEHNYYENYDYYYYNAFHDVRIEEMLNYFNYNYKTSNDIFTVNAEISDTPWNKDTQLLVLNVAAKELPKQENEGSNLVFLIDTSGSMSAKNKMGLVKESLALLVDELTENDTISIVTYSGTSEVLLDGVNGLDKGTILSVVNALTTGGSTNGEGGIKAAYEVAQRYQKTHSNSRIIMCSDGDLNVGITSEEELTKLVENKRKTGIYLSVLGFGDGNYKDNKMEALADNGNGNYYYIDNIKEGYKVLVEDLMSTLVTVADDVKFQVEFNPEYIKGYRKIGYENRDMADEDFHDDTKDGGEVGYGDSVTIVYELIPVNSRMRVEEGVNTGEKNTDIGDTDWLTVSVRYKDHGEKKSNLVEYIVNDDNYTEDPSDNWKFVSNVVGFGLLINDSYYQGDLTIDQVIENLYELDLVDRDKIELLSLAIAYGECFED